MKGVPPEIDSLLWRLAEEGSPAARAEFETRHARYGPELARRIAMVNELRLAGKTDVPRPRFTPRPVRRTSPPGWAVGTAACLVALAVGAVAYVTVPRPPVLPKPVVIQRHSGEESTDTLQPERPIPKPEAPPKTPVVQKEPEPEKARPYDLPRDTRIPDANLADAIGLVAEAGGLKITLAPGFKDERVSLDYRGLNTLDTLKAMGEEHGFSVLEEEEGSVLVVPVRTNDEPSRRIGP